MVQLHNVDYAAQQNITYIVLFVGRRDNKIEQIDQFVYN